VCVSGRARRNQCFFFFFFFFFQTYLEAVRRSFRRQHGERFRVRPDRQGEQLASEHGIAFDGADEKVGNDREQLLHTLPHEAGCTATRADATAARIRATAARIRATAARIRADATHTGTAARVATAAVDAIAVVIAVVVGQSCCRIHR
jgi:hypothetical protein